MLDLFTEYAPFLVASLGFILLWTKTAVRATPTWPEWLVVAWCVVALLAKQAGFMSDAGMIWRTSSTAGALAGALVPTALVLLIPKRRPRLAATFVVVAACAALLSIDRLYFAWFSDMFPSVAWMEIGHTSQMAGGARDLFTLRDFLRFVDLGVMLLFIAVTWRRKDAAIAWRARWSASAAFLVLAAAAGWQTAKPIRTDLNIVTQRFSNISLVDYIAPLPYHAMDWWFAIRRTVAREFVSDELFDEVLQWQKERMPLRVGTAPWFGQASGKNLIVLQVESLQEPIVNLRIDGQDVMPNLRKLAAEHLYFPNVIDQTDEGRTSDAEWMMLTSQMPAAEGAAAFVNSGNHLVSLPSVLAEHGYQSLSAVAFQPGFWNRRVMHPNYGFFRSYFANDFAPGERIGWGLNDRDFLLQMTPRLAAVRQPFAAWLITLSLHAPFEEFPDSARAINLGRWEHTRFGNYLHGMNYFDRALGEFMDSLSRAGLLDQSVLAIIGDHSAGLRWDSEVAHTLGFSNDLAHWTMAERVPLMIRAPGDHPETVTKTIGQVSFAPTVLGLLGIDPSPLPYVGRNALGNIGVEPVIRRNGGWVDEQHLFLLRGPTNGSHCFDRATLQDVDLAECGDGAPLAIRKALLQRRIQEFDLQQRIYARLLVDPRKAHPRTADTSVQP